MSDLLDNAVPVAIYLGGNSADLITTERALCLGARERNPFGQTFGRRLLLKSGSTLALTGADLVLQKIERRYVVVQRPGYMPERRRSFAAKAATVGKWTLRGVSLAYYARLTIKNTNVATKQEAANAAR